MSRILASFVLACICLCAASAAREEKKNRHDVDVVIEDHDFLPVTIDWHTKKDEKEVKESGSLDGTGKVPSGEEVFIALRPRYEGAYYHWATWTLEGQPYVGGSNGMRIKASSGAKIGVHILQPAPTWGGATVRTKGGGFMLITLRIAGAMTGVEKTKDGFRSKGGPGGEYYPNASLAWANYGSIGVAENLWKNFKQERKDKKRWGYFQGSHHVAVFLPATGKGVKEPFGSMKEEDFIAAVKEGLEIIRKQRPPVGLSIEEELREAAEILKNFSGPNDA